MEEIKELEEQIDKCIKRLRNATTGADVKISVIEYEQLSQLREKLFTEYVMRERKKENQIQVEKGQKESNAARWWLCIQGIAIIILAIAFILIKQ